MSKVLKRLAGDSIIYGLSGIITRLITIFLVPIYTRIFVPSDYGVMNLINNLFVLVSMFIVFSMDNSAARWFLDSKDLDDQKRTIATWFYSYLLLAVLATLILLIAVPVASKLIFNDSIRNSWLTWLCACLTLVANVFPTVIWNWFRCHKMAWATMIFTICQSLTTIGLTISFVVILKMGILGVYLALLVSALVFSIIALVIMRKWISLKYFNLFRLKEMAHFSAPLVLAAVSNWTIASTNSFFLAALKDQHEVGLFAIGNSLAGGISLFTGAFYQAWWPFAYSVMNNSDAKKTYASAFLIFGLFGGTLVLLMFLFSPEILKVFTTPKYYGASWVAPIMSLNFVLAVFVSIGSVGLAIAKKNSIIGKGVPFAAVIVVLLNLLLIPVWGKEGAAIATVLSQLLIPMYVFYHAQKYYFIPFDFTRVIAVFLSAILIGIMIRFIPAERTISIVLFKVAGLVLYGGIAFLLFQKKINLRRSLSGI